MKLPDGPKNPRILRLLEMILRPTEFMDKCQQQYGDNFAVIGSNNIPIVYMGHPKAIQQILTADRNQLSDVGAGGRVFELIAGYNSILVLQGDRHQRQRQLLTPPFHGEKMRAYGQSICEITQQVIEKWPINKPFPIRIFMQEISLQVILRLVFGLNEGQRLEKLRQAIASMLDSFNSPLTSSLFFFSRLQRDLGAGSPWRKLMEFKQKIDELIYAQIEEHRERLDASRNDILSLLMMAKDEADEQMTDEELRDELVTLLMAGHETTASALCWALYWIDRHPEVREKLLAELGTTSDTNIISRLPYLNAVCCETLRIYPVATQGFVRKVRSPIKIMDYEFEPGTTLFPSIYLAHHRPETYPEPKSFKPERFLEKQYSPYEYLPFGGGNRRCIGMAFAQFEMKLVLATILSQFRLSLVDKRLIRPVRRGLTIAPPGNMQMVAIRQEQRTPIQV